jgi:hypothetical protein
MLSKLRNSHRFAGGLVQRGILPASYHGNNKEGSYGLRFSGKPPEVLAAACSP